MALTMAVEAVSCSVHDLAEHVPVVGGGVPQRLRREEQALYRLLVLHRAPLEDVVLVERDDAPEGRELEVAPDRHVPGVPVLLDEPAGVGGPAQSGEAPLGVVGVHVVERVRCKAQRGG